MKRELKLGDYVVPAENEIVYWKLAKVVGFLDDQIEVQPVEDGVRWWKNPEQIVATRFQIGDRVAPNYPVKPSWTRGTVTDVQWNKDYESVMFYFRADGDGGKFSSAPRFDAESSLKRLVKRKRRSLRKETKIDMYSLVTEAVESGVQFGLNRCDKYDIHVHDNRDSAVERITSEVMNALCERISFR